MIGMITLPSGVKLVLPDSGPIQSNDPELGRFANFQLQRYQQEYSPSHGPFGPRFLSELAEKLGGEVTLEEKPPGPEGAIY